jgi:Ca-activated chloride channel homolog
MHVTGTHTVTRPGEPFSPRFRTGYPAAFAIAVLLASLVAGVACTSPQTEPRDPGDRRTTARAGAGDREPVTAGAQSEHAESDRTAHAQSERSHRERATRERAARQRTAARQAEARRHAETSLHDPSFARVSVVNGEPYPDMYFQHYGVNPTIDTSEEPASTFATDVDTASYALARAYLQRGDLPSEAAVRVEEFVNAFDYGYPAPESETFGLQVEAFPSPHRQGYHVLHIGIQGREVANLARDPVDLVLVVDVSGSMNQGNRLALLQRSVETLVAGLDGRDTVGIITFNQRSHEVLAPTAVDAHGKRRILDAVTSLRAGGSTSVAAGVSHGYRMASERGRESAQRRVILFSDGVANTGVTAADAVFDDVARAHGKGIPLTAIGVGLGNYNDMLLERLAQRGGGSYHYIDELSEARRVFQTGLVGLLQPIARDVKVQVAFDPSAVARYRLLGFENRRLEAEDFEDDNKDGGGVGAGHSVTALYEVRFHGAQTHTGGAASFAALRVRYHPAEGGAPRLIERDVPFSVVRDRLEQASAPARLSLVAAAFAEKLRGSYWVRRLSYRDVLAVLDDLPGALRARADVRELRALIVKAETMDRRPDRFADISADDDMNFDRVPVLR